MCGIIGYKGNKSVGPILLNGLRGLEYRGYDSVGVAIIINGSIKIEKDIGKVEEVNTKLNIGEMDGNIGIAHTRWATTGDVTKENSHPHISNNKKIVVVHNGIIENFQELRKELIGKGYKFHSETDTEVIPNYIEFLMNKGESFVESVRKTLLEIEGSSAFVALNGDENKMVGARRGSPLVLGVGVNEFFLGSDVPAFLEHTRNVVYLDDNEVAVVDDDFYVLDAITENIINKKIQKINWSLEQAKKGNYPHYMLKEIYEQKFTIKKAVEQNEGLLEEVTNRINNAYGIFFVGCGTSYHACLSASYMFSKVAGKHVNVVLASEFRNYEHFLTDKTLMIAVSQSGETADLLDAVKVAKQKGVKVVSIVNVVGSSLTRLADKNVIMNCGPEICVLSTKSYTAQLALLYLLAYSSAGLIKNGKDIVAKSSEFVSAMIDKNINVIEELAEDLKDSKDMFLIGRDLAYATALEGALKIKEVSYIHAEGFAGGELKHGTIALIEKDVPVIAISDEHTEKLTISNAMEVKARGAKVIGIGVNNNEVYDYFIEIPNLPGNMIMAIIPIQILSYYLALKRGCDVDKPRNLAKSVVVR